VAGSSRSSLLPWGQSPLRISGLSSRARYPGVPVARMKGLLASTGKIARFERANCAEASRSVARHVAELARQESRRRRTSEHNRQNSETSPRSLHILRSGAFWKGLSSAIRVSRSLPALNVSHTNSSVRLVRVVLSLRARVEGTSRSLATVRFYLRRNTNEQTPVCSAVLQRWEPRVR
jgi:hypothetical protein